MRSGFLFFVTVFFASSAFAFNIGKCSSYLNDGLYKKYEYRGLDNPGTKATKKHGSSGGTSATSTEGSTASVDPKWWWHSTMSGAQYLSSWGPCSGIGLQHMKEEREAYFAQNKEEVVKEIARGEGEHLRVIAVYSLCEDPAISSFTSQLQKHTAQFINKADTEKFGDIIDEAVEGDQILKTACYSFKS